MSLLDSKAEKDRIQLGREWGAFLDRSEWSYFSTLTFKRSTTGEYAARQFLRWIRRLETVGRSRVDWVYFVERSPAGTVHLHALSRAPVGLTTDELDFQWTAGWSDHSKYERCRGAASYIAKELGTARLEEYDVSARLVPYRR